MDVAILTQVHPGRSHSGAAQGGVNGALANHPDAQDDSPQKHAFDTVKGSDYLADQPAALQMTTDAVPAIYELEHMGCPFSRFDDGRIAQRPFGGAGYPRTCYGADKTGHYMLHTLVEQAYKHEITMYIEWFVMRLIVEDGECRGVVAYDMVRGGFEEFRGDAVIMATGGAGRTYSNTTNAVISTGFGAAMAYHDGVPLKDMEFVQFHPTGLYTTHILMTEGCRGEGGYLLNDLGERFMLKLRAVGEASWRRATSPRAPSSRRSTPGAASAARTSSTWTCATWAPRSSRSACPALATWRSTSRALTRSTSPSPSSPASTTRWAASTRTWTARPGCPTSGRPASAPA